MLHFRTLFGTPLFRINVLPGDARLAAPTSSDEFEHSFRGARLLGLVPESDSPYFSRSWVIGATRDPPTTQTNKY